jgi:4-hydroxybenzoate polyprenyltransferase
MNDAGKNSIIKDSDTRHWVNRSPAAVRPYLQLSRLDRPVGYWLLALPGWIGLAFASLSYGFAWIDLKWAGLILIGAIAMRGAGCTYNDILDQDLDAQVERTALRPLPAGTVTNRQAWGWLVLQCFIGLLVLLCLPRLAQIISLFSIPLVAAYPFMKRITWWPQLWLGLTFNWAVLVAYAAKTGVISTPLIIFYAGLIFWTVGYDTIYACQDIEDDAMVGIKSTARKFGKNVKPGVLTSYGLAALIIFMALHLKLREPLINSAIETRYHQTIFDIVIIFFLFLPFLFHLMTQVRSIRLDAPEVNLKIFKSNFGAAILLLLCCLLGTAFHYALALDLLGFTDTDLSIFE